MSDALATVLDEAYEALYEDRLDAARAALDRARRINAKSAEVRLFEVELLDAEGQSEEAVTAAEEAIEALPKSMLLKLKLATLLLDVYDDVAGARPHLEELLLRLDKGEEPDVGAIVGEAAALSEAKDDFRVEVLLTLSDARAADHDPRGALALAERAAKAAPEDPMARVALGAALFDVCRLDEAEKAVAQAIDRDPRCADGYWLRGRILTAKGDHAGADKAFARAIQIDGERFQTPFRVTEDVFAKLMEESLEELPKQVRDFLKNIAIVVGDVPQVELLTKGGEPLSPGLLGLFETGAVGGVEMPTRITLFRKNIEIACADEDDLRDQVSTTLLHEVGHYLGLDEGDLDERGLG